MGGVDLIDQKKTTYELDRRATIKYYLRPFFDFRDAALLNSFTVFCKIMSDQFPDDRLAPDSNLDFKRTVAKSLLADYSGRKRSIPTVVTTRKGLKLSIAPKAPEHAMSKSTNRKRCVECSKSNIENRTNNICTVCMVHLCFVKDRNCFAAYHSR